MKEQIQGWRPLQRGRLGSNMFMIVGIILLTSGNLLLLTVGRKPSAGPAVLVGPLSISAIVIGPMLFLIGLVNKTKKQSLRWLRITVTIICGILVVLALLYALLVSVLFLSGF